VTYTLEQSATAHVSDTGLTPPSAPDLNLTWAAPTPGNLLVAWVAQRDVINSLAPGGTTVNDWTLFDSVSTGDILLLCFTKIAGVSEPTTVDMEPTFGTTKSAIWIGEYSAPGGAQPLADEDEAFGTATSLSVGPLSVGPGSLVIGAAMAAASGEDISWSTLTELWDVDTTSAGGARSYFSVAADPDASGSVSDTPAWTTAKTAAAMLVAAPVGGIVRVIEDSLALSDTVDYSVGAPAAARTIEDTLGITDGGSVQAGLPGTEEVVRITDGISWALYQTEVPIPDQRVASFEDWGVWAYQRIPSQSGEPTYLELGEIPFTTLYWTRRLNQPHRAVISAPLASTPAAVRAALKTPWATPVELALFRFDTPLMAGPVWPGTLAGGTLSINAGGTLGYLRGMIGTATDLSYFATDQALIVKGLVDHYQAKPYGHFGLDTSEVILTGVARDRNYLAAEPNDVLSLITNLTNVQGGPDVSMLYRLSGLAVERVLRVHYPQQGRDLSSAVVLDASNITSVDGLGFGVGPADIATVAVTLGGDVLTAPIRAETSDPTLMGSWGRWGAVEVLHNVSNPATVLAHAAELLDSRSGRIFLPAPALRSTAELNPASVDTGDVVKYDFDDGLSHDVLTGRLAEITVTVDSAGERLRVQLA
jgi:hypothetical protein